MVTLVSLKMIKVKIYEKGLQYKWSKYLRINDVHENL